MKILYFFIFFGVIFALLDPDPDPAAQINADPCGSGYGYGSGSETLAERQHIINAVYYNMFLRFCREGKYSILFYYILFYSILFYSILFYIILFYSILFYSILFYSILSEFSRRLLCTGMCRPIRGDSAGTVGWAMPRRETSWCPALSSFSTRRIAVSGLCLFHYAVLRFLDI